MTKRIIKADFKQKSEQKENEEIIKRGLCKSVLERGPVTLDSRSWEEVEQYNLTIEKANDQIVIDAVDKHGRKPA